MSFTRFDGKRVQETRPMVCLTEDATFVFNKASVVECLREAKYVELYFDPGERLIGLKFLQAAQTCFAYKLSPHLPKKGQRRGITAFVTCREFFKAHGIPRRKLHRLLAWNAREKLWTFKVKAIA